MLLAVTAVPEEVTEAFQALTIAWLPPQVHVTRQVLVATVPGLLTVTVATKPLPHWLSTCMAAEQRAVPDAPGVGVTDGRGVGVTEGRGVGVTDGRGVGVTDGRGVGVTEGRGVGVTDGPGVWDPLGTGVAVREALGVGPMTGGTSQSLCTRVIFVALRAPHVPQADSFEPAT